MTHWLLNLGGWQTLVEGCESPCHYHADVMTIKYALAMYNVWRELRSSI